MRIRIVNNSLGNVGSVLSALNFYRYDAKLAETPKDLKQSDIIILAGVGNFNTAITRLKKLKLWDTLNEEILENKKPVFGICLGMQLFSEISYEGGTNQGFGWIRGKVQKIQGKNIRIPHIGWNEVKPLDTTLFRGMRYNQFYYMHSYHFIPDNKKLVIAITQYGDLNIVAAIRKENIIGVQFHPEKSQGDGLRLFRNILEEFA